jgi:hypothetical protein
LRDHGRSIHDSRPWEFDFLFDSGSRSIVAEDPLRTEIEIELAGDCLRATIDDSGRVVKTEELD